MNITNEIEGAYIQCEIGVFEWPKSATDGSAGAATAETAIGLIGPGPVNIGLASVQFHTSAALTSNDSNYATIIVSRRPSGGAAVIIAQVTTQTVGGGGSGTWAAWTAINIPLIGAAGKAVLPGDSITLTITKTGTGVVVPQGYLAGFAAIQ